RDVDSHRFTKFLTGTPFRATVGSRMGNEARRTDGDHMTDDSTYKTITAWEQFKQVNDARLREIERKGAADPLYDEHLHNIGSALDNHKASRPQPASNTPPSHSRGSEYDRAFRTYLRKGMDGGLEALQAEALAVGSDPDGG